MVTAAQACCTTELLATGDLLIASCETSTRAWSRRKAEAPKVATRSRKGEVQVASGARTWESAKPRASPAAVVPSHGKRHSGTGVKARCFPTRIRAGVRQIERDA
jgi:hypothetical protein